MTDRLYKNPNQSTKMTRQTTHVSLREFYDETYYHGTVPARTVAPHLCRLARRFQPWRGKRLLDVACGTGEWLRSAAQHGAVTAGIDLSRTAVAVCRSALPQAEIHCGPAEELPFADRTFDFVSCLGALEHFDDPEEALREIIRVAKPSADFLFLVPNADFPPRRFGLYAGTEQAAVREDVRTLHEWEQLFLSAGLQVIDRWRDLHVLSSSWIKKGPAYFWPVRLVQAMALPLWPISWQYQVYYLCKLK